MTLIAARAMLPVDWRLDRERPRLNYLVGYWRKANRTGK